MANIDWEPCWCQDHWRIHSARVLHWIHLQGSIIPSQNLLRSDLSNQNNPQEDDWHHHARCFDIWFEGSRQQASPRLDRQGHREVVPRSLPIARCLHPQGKLIAKWNVNLWRSSNRLVGESVEEASFRLVQIVGAPRRRRKIGRANSNSRCHRRRRSSRATRRIRATSTGRRLNSIKTIFDYDGFRV